MESIFSVLWLIWPPNIPFKQRKPISGYYSSSILVFKSLIFQRFMHWFFIFFGILTTFQTFSINNRARQLTFVCRYWIYSTYRTLLEEKMFPGLRAPGVACESILHIFQIFDISKPIISRRQQHNTNFLSF